MKRLFGIVPGLALALGLVACGPSYVLPRPDAAQLDRAARIYAQAQAAPPTRMLTDAQAESRFRRVEARVSPVAIASCKELAGQLDATDKGEIFCGVLLGIDTETDVPNAALFPILDEETQQVYPAIVVTQALLKLTRNDDEAAFVLAHEYGHLLGGHIQKQYQQIMSGTVLGNLLGGGNIGAQIASQAYSGKYELEGDAFGTRIAYAAGYDPIKGAQIFARLAAEAENSGESHPALFETHPPDVERIAMVLATLAQIQAGIDPTRKVLH
ncbi:M48 family metallopeptidase [Rhodobacteraceae bacterium M382]|nr:M48 family metallopeptidase [Rhodobacteraceae bacterium M382]